MNNKKLGTEFEREAVEWFAKNGWWVHFLSPDASGAQPFDLIAVKDGIALAAECKTQDSKNRYFPISRLEDNQIMAFEKWLACGNPEPIIFVEYKNEIKMIEYSLLKRERKVDLDAL